jgi:hypothetical protein
MNVVSSKLTVPFSAITAIDDPPGIFAAVACAKMPKMVVVAVSMPATVIGMAPAAGAISVRAVSRMPHL